MECLPMEDDLVMDSPSTLNCQAFQTLSHRNLTPSDDEEMSSLNYDYRSDSSSSENVVEYAVLLPDSFVVLDWEDGRREREHIFKNSNCQKFYLQSFEQPTKMENE